VTVAEAKRTLELEGIYVSMSDRESFWIAGSFEFVEVGRDNVRLSQDACVLFRKNDHWQAVLPGLGMLTREVYGSLDELVALIVSVYRHYRQSGGPLYRAVEQVVADAERYLVGGVPARV